MDIQVQKKFKILLLGDDCTDVYQYGTVERISPEAPVPIFKYSHQESKPGMAANVLLNLQTLGLDVDFVTNNTESIKTRLIDIRSKQQLLRIDNDSFDKPLTLDSIPKTGYDAIVISDYNKGSISYELIEILRTIYYCPMFLDTKKQDLVFFDNIYVKINELEYKNSHSTNDKLIVTLGNKGAMYKSDTYTKYFTTPAVEVSDVCGAGDTFLAALVYEFLHTNNIEKAIEFANKAASLTVQHIGNYAPTLEEILCQRD
jgi:bifunctional ADP-heptose synthase (sugar kinase/adenylyltransferase)